MNDVSLKQEKKKQGKRGNEEKKQVQKVTTYFCYQGI